MVYELKDQDVTPPSPDEVDPRSAAGDGLAAVAIVLLAIGLITLVLTQII